MKKQLPLYVLAMLGLTACGGGSGSGGGTSGPRAAVGQDAINSNSAITKMVSEIGVDSDGNHGYTAARSASGTVSIDGRSYNSYRLDDVDFKTLVTSGRVDGLKFDVDSNGRIKGIHFVDSMNKPNNCGNNESCVPTGNATRNGDTNSFAYSGYGINGNFTYQSYAEALDLSFSDFGVIKLSGTSKGNPVDIDIPFAGGYDVKKIDKSELTADATFTGIAAGFVEGKGDVGYLNLEDNNATLVFNKASGSQTLSASFGNWYDIQAVNNNGRTTLTVDDQGRTIGDEYQIQNQPTANMQNGFGNNTEAMAFEANYYGNTKTKNPSEASALLQYQTPGNDGERVNLFLGFGGVK
jgi:hypothetical protein